MRELITGRDGAPTFAMRHFTVEPGGHTPHHFHPWEHEVFILEGRGELTCADKTVALEPGMAVYVPAN
ncbi:MAG: cupin domain-containing protein [Armatimonadetes bacterium]|nr:cupin domain-containing protein [Armatimonadota bacterium]